MQTVYEDEAITIAPHQDGCLLSDFKYTLRDLLDGLWFERCAALYRRRCSRSQIFLASSWYVSEVRQREILSPRTVSKTLFQLAPPIKPIAQKL